MIRIDRGPAPPCLDAVRAAELRRVRAERRGGGPVEIGKQYNLPEVRAALHEAQHATCCYREFPIQKMATHLEHLRPKEKALRGPGRPEHGYWWLTWDWENLLLACSACNLTKGIKFPLSPRGGVLRQRATPPGPERPLFIDPAAEDPLKLIRFSYVGGRWRPIPRKRGLRAKTTIREIGLDAPDLLDRYREYIEGVINHLTRDVRARIRANDPVGVKAAWARLRGILFSRTAPFKALSYDVLDRRFPGALRATWKLALPKP